MAKAEKITKDSQNPREAPRGSAPPPDELYQLLANQRRRYAVQILKDQKEAVHLGMLAELVAAREENVNPPEVTPSLRKSVYTGLQQRHLPKMDEAGLVSFDRSRRTVEPTDFLYEIDLYTESNQSGEFPWSHYYLVLSTVSGTALVASWANLPLFLATTPATWGIFCIVSLALSASIHTLTAWETEREVAPDSPTESD